MLFSFHFLILPPPPPLFPTHDHNHHPRNSNVREVQNRLHRYLSYVDKKREESGFNSLLLLRALENFYDSSSRQQSVC
ncbi:hypothetical protein CAEBREN_11422 [Caenorhabditis brenneri]|uniref:Uncharacterized protein n=1 Tax=Caenorhabditis brenneri TaxID=135651 RepID=G0MVT0_CAEBE|nr:hypothetical protein CAEBREN_11422 [Caenorhabditis brenneri]